MTRRKVMIYAYTAHNLGDDLFIHILCQRYPHITFYLYAPKKYKETFSNITNLHIMPSDTLIGKMMYYLLLRPSIAVYIGGSLFIEQPGWKKHWKQMKQAQKRHANFFILGANFGPYHSLNFYHKYEDFFKNCDDICFRDKNSYHLFKHLPNVRYANDVVFTQPVDHVNKTVATIVISVIYPSIRKELQDINDAYFNTLASLAVACMNEGYNIVWMAFCKREKDDQAIEQIYKLIHPQYYSHMMSFDYETDIATALQLIAQANAVIATRFHAMILSLLYEKPTFAIIYSNKMLTVIEDNALTIPHCHIKQCYGENVIKKMRTACSQDAISVEYQINDAENQFRILDSELEVD